MGAARGLGSWVRLIPSSSARDSVLLKNRLLTRAAPNGGRRVFGPELVDAVRAALQLGHGSGVRDANVPVSAKRLAGNYRDVRLGQQTLRKLQSIVNAVFAD